MIISFGSSQHGRVDAFASWPQATLCALIDDLSNHFCIIIYCTGGLDARLGVLWMRKMFAASQW